MAKKRLSASGKRAGQRRSGLAADPTASKGRTRAASGKADGGSRVKGRAPDLVAPRGVPFPVVGVGASAGGFEAVTTLLKNLATDTGMAFVVVLHLDPRHKSKLTELLARATTMPAREIHDAMAVQPNNVYILPPNRDVILTGGKLKLVHRPESERLHLPVDHFFNSLAEQQGSRAIGIVLSGTGSDGTLGLIAIKAEAGITFAEAEASAKYFGMPQSAIDSGCVDAVMTPQQMAKELERIARHPFVRLRRPKAKVPDELPESVDSLGKIFFLLQQSSGVDFSLYKPTTLRRRIRRRMVLQRIERIGDYVTLLRSDPEELEALFHDLLINVTGFFRDRNVYATLKKKVFPKIIKNRGNPSEIRVWVPGCATGEEVYSLAICLVEELNRSRRQIRLRIFGTDLSDAAIAKARTGVYPGTIVKDVSPERLRRFFTRANGSYQVSRLIRDACTFARQNICEDPPFSRLDLISCRNVLIYLGPELQNKCMPIFHYALNPGGYLLLGTSETASAAADLFTLVDKKHKIYCRKAIVPVSNLDFGARAGKLNPTELSPAAPATKKEIEPALDVHKQVDRILLHHYTPVGVVVDRHLRVHEFRGSTGPYLEHAPGSASLNLLQMVRPSLIVDLRTTIHKALKQRTPARKEGAVLRINGSTRLVNLHVVPFTVAPSSDLWLLVLFDQPGHAAGMESERPETGRDRNRGRGTGRPDPEVNRLQVELDSTKESLQAIIEEQEATNEELKSANEEIESSNEELQSTNEELETAKEELQSTNEELTTLNEELSNRNLEMAQVNNDLTNLLSSINIPIIMVDNSLAVRRATPMAERLFNLIPTDVGRRLSDLKANLNINNLDQMIHEVIDTLDNRDTRVQDSQGRWYSLRIRPYRTRENKIDGAVVTLVDIDEDQRRIDRLELAAQYTDAVLDTVHEPLLILDTDLCVRTASRSFCETFKLDRKKIEGTPLAELAGGAWNTPELRRALLEDVLSRNRRLDRFKLVQESPKLPHRAWMMNARRLGTADEHVVLLALEICPDPPLHGAPAATNK